MSAIINWLETGFDFLPLPLLEVWGRLAYIIGFALAISAYGGFTFRPGGRWGFGREHQAWDAKAVLSIPVTFVLIIATGYIGSFIVLVPGAQTFESLKDLMVFLCIVLFGYPALIAVPFAYGISDLIEGVPPGFLLDWLPGYFINPSCFWVAYQLFGKNPDFRRVRTWALYLLFVLAFMSTEPVLWGYICAGKFTSVISYGNITPALFFTTAITWIMAPFAMLVVFPLARKFGMFWAEIPGHVKERRLACKEWAWEAGVAGASPGVVSQPQGWPIRMVLLTPFIALVLLMVGATAYVTLRSAEDDAHKLATQLHDEISDNINLQLDEYLAENPNVAEAVISDEINTLLKGLLIAKHGVALVVNRAGNIIASSAKENDPVAAKAIIRLRESFMSSTQLKEGFQFRFDHVTEKPLAREIWLAHATAYADRRGGHADWIVLTLMPESFYLAGVQTGNSRSAMVFAVALLLSLAVAALLAALVTNRLRRISLATQALAQGNLDQRAPGSRMEELDTLARSFNDMAERLKKSFGHLNEEIELRKQADQELQASEELFRTSFESATVGVCLVATDGRFLNVNRTLCDMLGYAEDELLQLTFSDITHDEDKEIGRTFFRNVLSGGPKTLQVEKRYLHKDGQVVWAYLSSALIEQPSEHGGYLISYVQDITERKRASEQLDMLKVSVDKHFDAAYWMDTDNQFIYVNDTACKVLGYAREELLGKPVTMIAPSATPQILEEVWKRLRETGFFARESKHCRKDGSEFPVEIVATYVWFEGKEINCGFARDITERKRLEHKQVELAAIVASSDDAIIGKSLTGVITSWNRGAEKMFGYSAAEVIGQPLLMLIPADRKHEETEILAKIERGEAVEHYETVRIRKDGRQIYISATISPLKDGLGKVVGASKIARDITEQKRAEAELISKTALLEAQVDSTIDGILVVDEQGRRILQNRRFLNMYQVPEEIARDADHLKLLKHASSQIKNPQQFIDRVTYLYAHPDEIGRDEVELADGRIFDRYSAPIRDKAGKHFGRIWTFRDITEHRKLETQFRQAQKMDAIGQLAGGVAHDFNNILAVIQMQSDLLRSSGDLSAEQSEFAGEIIATVQRAAALTRQLLLFSRREVFQPRDLSLSESISNTAKMLRRILGENIEMQLKLASQPMFVHADPGMIDQVLLNLVVNARDAMPEGGRLVIETSGVEFDGFAASQTAQAHVGLFVCLSVSDTGSGIPPEILPKIFEPFFTTKGVGKGTGLGLATVFGIVQQHQGWINVYSEPGHGTAFKIYLPWLAGMTDKTLAQKLLTSTRNGSETILLVEDDPSLRASVRKALSQLGYRILEASTGIKALEVWKQNREEIRLLLTDMVMPDGMTGKELGRHILHDDPKQKVIYMSGFSTEVVGKDFLLEEGVNFLAKPFQASKLAQIIRDSLDHRA